MGQEQSLDALLYDNYFCKVDDKRLSLEKGNYGPNVISFYQTKNPKYANELRTRIIDDTGEVCKEYQVRIKELKLARDLPSKIFGVGFLILPVSPTIGITTMFASAITWLGYLNRETSLEKEWNKANKIRNGLQSDPNAVYRVLRTYETRIKENINF